MRTLIAIFAVAAITLAMASESHAQKGFGQGGYAGYGYGWNGYGQGGYGYGGYGGYGYGNWSPHRYYGGYHHLGNVPVIPPPAYNAGPPTAAVTYPYYTTRGPRDFLMNDPPSIGP